MTTLAHCPGSGVLVPRPPAGVPATLDCGLRCPPLGAHPVVPAHESVDSFAPPRRSLRMRGAVPWQTRSLFMGFSVQNLELQLIRPFLAHLCKAQYLHTSRAWRALEQECGALRARRYACCW